MIFVYVIFFDERFFLSFDSSNSFFFFTFFFDLHCFLSLDLLSFFPFSSFVQLASSGCQAETLANR